MVVTTDNMDVNRICEAIVSDIIGGATISEILLKTQLLAALTGIEKFQQWVDQEQNGYKKPFELPEYRKLHCNVTAILSIPFHVGTVEMNVPVDAIQLKSTRDLLSTVFYDSPAIAAEQIATTAEVGRFRKSTPAMAHMAVQPLFPNIHVEAVYQDLTSVAFVLLVESVKSKILAFILRLDKEGVLTLALRKPDDRDLINKIYCRIFNDSVASSGEDDITPERVFLVSHDPVSPNNVQTLKDMFSRLNVLLREEKDRTLQDALDALNVEINLAAPSRSNVKKCLAIIKGLAIGVSCNEVTTIANAALGVL